MRWKALLTRCFQSVLSQSAILSGRPAGGAELDPDRGSVVSTNGKRWSYRPAGALCVQCNYRPARLSVKFPDRAFLYCSDVCQQRAARQQRDLRMRDLTEAVRRRVGLHDGRGKNFTVPELEAIVKHLDRIQGNHYGGLYLLPRARKVDGRYRRKARLPA